MEKYKPLELIKNNHLLNFLENQTAKMGIKPILAEGNENELIENAFEGKLYTSEKYESLKPLFDRFNDIYKNNWLKTCYNLSSFVIGECIENLWTKNKQVIIVDKNFQKVLLNQKRLVLPYDIPSYLPFDTFVLDLQDQDDIVDTEYLFCHIQQRFSNSGFLLSIIRVVKDKIFTVYSKEFNNVKFETFIDESGEKLCDLDKKYLEWDFVKDDKNTLKTEDGKVVCDNSQENMYYLLVLQVFLYLYLQANNQKVDIKESDDSPDGVKKWNLGKDYAKSESVILQSKGKIKAHFRSAHWSHFWTGTKEKGYTCVPRWIEGYFVNGTAKDIDVTERILTGPIEAVSNSFYF